MNAYNSVSENELSSLSKLIDKIYQGATDIRAWDSLLPEVAGWVNASCGLLFTPLHTPSDGGFYFNHAIPESVCIYGRQSISSMT